MIRLLPRLRRSPEPAPRPRVEPTVTMPQRPPMRVSLSALAASLAKPPDPAAQINPFKLPRYAKGVLPNGRTELAMDEATTIVASTWDFGAALHGMFAEGIGFMGYPYLAELSQRAEYRRASEVIAEEMTRKWISLKATGEQDKTDKLKVLADRLDQFKVREVFRTALEHDGFFGIGMLFFDFGDTDGSELRTPLAVTPEKIGRHRLKAIRTIDPTWVAPNRYDARDPTSPTFYRPQAWFVMGREIHSSRLLTLISRPLPDILKPAYNFGGLSLSAIMKPYVDNWLRTRQSISDLINAFTIFNLSTNLEGLLAGAGGEAENQRLELMTNIRNNRGMLVTDKNTEELKNISAPLGTLDHLQAQAQEQICSVIAVPLVKYLGVTPSGLNASADGEIRVFYDGIKARQEKICGDPVRTIIQVLQLDEWGEIDPEIDFEFVPLWELDEAAAAGVRKTEADTDAVLVELGAIDADEVRQRVAAEPDSPYSGLDLSKPAPGPPSGGLGGEGEGLPGAEGPPPPGTASEDAGGLGGAILAALRQNGVSDHIGDALLEALALPPRTGTDTGPDIGSAVATALRGGGRGAVVPFDDDDDESVVPESVLVALRAALAADEETFKETDHPRDDSGKFSSGGGGGGGGAQGGPAPLKPALPQKASPMAKGFAQVALSDLPVTQKIAIIQAKKANKPETKDYQKALVAWLKGQPNSSKPGEKPADKPADKPGEGAIPEPHPDSVPQKYMHKIATGDGTTSDKLEQIEYASAPGPHSQEYKAKLIKALGGNPNKTAPPEPPSGSETKIATPNTARYARGISLREKATDTENAATPEARKACPTLRRAWWEKSDVSAEGRQACVDYKGSSGAINGMLREQDEGYTTTQAKIDAIDELFEHEDARLTEDVVLRRGEHVNPTDIDKWKKALAAGKLVRPQRTGFTSTSMASHAAMGGNVVYEIIARKGTPALGLYAASHSFKSENEVLLRHGSVFEVYEIEQKGSQHIVRCYTF